MDGKARCSCAAGYREIPGLGCRDDAAPTLVLKGPAQLTMKQCDKYIENGVEVVDANSENDDRCVMTGVGYRCEVCGVAGGVYGEHACAGVCFEIRPCFTG